MDFSLELFLIKIDNYTQAHLIVASLAALRLVPLEGTEVHRANVLAEAGGVAANAICQKRSLLIQ